MENNGTKTDNRQPINFIPLSAVTKTAPRLDLDAVKAKLSGKSGQAYWRSLEEVSGSPEFAAYLEKEFPRQAPRDMTPLSRRDFMKLMGASLALAGVGGCAFQPQEKIVPYAGQQPEELIAGLPLYYATAMTMGGYALGLLAESHMGRPTKLEGNPDHPSSLGATDAFAQAAVLTMYDPDRSQVIRKAGGSGTWDQFLGEVTTQLQGLSASGGEGLRILTGTTTSPTLAAQMANLKKTFPKSRWHQYEPINSDSARAGSRLAFGRDLQPMPHYGRAQRIVSLDCDFLLTEPDHVRSARDFMSGRRVRDQKADATAQMNRLYMVESTPTITGATADHRFPLRASDVESFTRVLAERLGVAGIAGATLPASKVDKPTLAAFTDALVTDLQAHKGTSLIVAGSHQSPAVHALAHAMNAILGNNGKTIDYVAPVTAGTGDQTASLRELVTDMNANRVKALVVLGVNPVYDAPADLKFEDAFKDDRRVPFRVHSGLFEDETAAWAHWHIPEAHFLEAWSDARSYDGTATIVQPLIAPLYEAAHSIHEIVAAISGQGSQSGYDLVRGHWERDYASRTGAPLASSNGAPGSVSGGMGMNGGAAMNGNGLSGSAMSGGARKSGSGTLNGGAMRSGAAGVNGMGGGSSSNGSLGNGQIAGAAPTAGPGTNPGQTTAAQMAGLAWEKKWRAMVHDGFVKGTAAKPVAVAVGANLGASLPPMKPVANGLEIMFRPDPTIWDGRFANNGWLQELAKPLTKLTWDNAALMSLRTAQQLGVTNQDIVQLSQGGRSVVAPVMVMPGHPDGAVTAHLGYGRWRAGKVGGNSGVSPFQAPQDAVPDSGIGTGSGIGFNAFMLRTSDAPHFASGLTVKKLSGHYKLATTAHHNLIDALDPSIEKIDNIIHGEEEEKLEIDGTHGRDLVRVGRFDDFLKGTLPTKAEEDKKGLPIDFRAERPTDEMLGNPSLYPRDTDITQRYNAPKANEENPQTYAWGMAIDLNACIGCNACVIGCQSENNSAITGKDQVLMNREMHWLRIDTYYKGDVDNPEAHFEPMMCQHCEKAPCEPVCPVEATLHSPEGINEMVYNRCIGTRYCSNNCPYKVRRFNFLQYSDQETPQITLMKNPDVTVRARGVMEKCTYCIQRVNNAKFQADKEDREVQDGEVITACQQVCPTDAIVFGNMNDEKSQVRKLKDNDLTFGILTELNTMPRTSYMAKIRNFNPALAPAEEVGSHGTTRGESEPHERKEGSH